MSEFKGSKGEWVVKNNCIYKKEHIRPNVAGGKPIAFINVTDFFEPDEIKANALLISKAPELLQLIQDIRDDREAFSDIRSFYGDRIDKLLKEATEL